MSKPRLLDLFCGAGGAAMGYYRAGFDVVGVDIEPQPHYPFAFHQADAMTYPLDGFDMIHASPPCQHYSTISKAFGYADRHPDLVAATRQRLQESSVPWIMENVVGAPFQHALILCGSHFRLLVYRHRLFESSHYLWSPGPCRHCYKPISVYGEQFWDSSCRSSQRKNGPRAGEWRPGRATKQQAEAAMGIDWMSHKELSQAIPPEYTRWVGLQIMAVL